MSAPFNRYQSLVDQTTVVSTQIAALVGQAWTEGAKDGMEACAASIHAVVAVLEGTPEAKTTLDVLAGLRDEIRLRALGLTTPTPEDNKQ